MLNQLKNLGLSENEARVYLAMLELGHSTMLQIAAKAEINRPTAYVQIERLKKLGLASTQIKGKKQFFIAEDPNQLLLVIEEESRTAEQKKIELAKLLPKLESIFRLAGDKPQVRFFEGRGGLLRMQEDFLTSGEMLVLGISAMDEVFRVFPQFSESYVPGRVKRGIYSKLIYTTKDEQIIKLMSSNTAMLRESKYISPDKFPISTDITIYKDSVAIATLKEKLFGTIIINKDVANSFRGMFNLIWTTADTV